MARLIIGFTGEAGSGKDAASHYLIERHGARAFGFSSIIRDLIHRLYLVEDRQTMATLSRILRESFGEDLFGRVIAKDIASCDADLIVVSGIRRTEDMQELSRNPAFRLIYVEAPADVRFTRIRMRGQNANDATMTFEEFKNEGELETERRIRNLKPLAHHVVENTGTVFEFYQTLDKILAESRPTA